MVVLIDLWPLVGFQYLRLPLWAYLEERGLREGLTAAGVVFGGTPHARGPGFMLVLAGGDF